MTVHLDSNMVPAHLRQGYAGKMFRAEVREQVTIPFSAGLWSGGSRDLFAVVRLADGAKIDPANQGSAPWDGSRRDTVVTLEPGIAVIEHTIFCGKDLGLRFYVHPADAAKLLPAPVELSALERLVLTTTAHKKSSYAGKDRYEMARDDACPCWQADYKARLAAFPTRADWDAAKVALIGRGMLNKAGAITTAGRNAIA